MPVSLTHYLWLWDLGYINIQTPGSPLYETRWLRDTSVSRLLHFVQGAKLLNVWTLRAAQKIDNSQSAHVTVVPAVPFPHISCPTCSGNFLPSSGRPWHKGTFVSWLLQGWVCQLIKKWFICHLFGWWGHALLHHDDGSMNIFLLHSLAICLDGLNANLWLIRKEDKHLIWKTKKCLLLVQPYLPSLITVACPPKCCVHSSTCTHIHVQGLLNRFSSNLILKTLKACP